MSEDSAAVVTTVIAEGDDRIVVTIAHFFLTT